MLQMLGWNILKRDRYLPVLYTSSLSLKIPLALAAWSGSKDAMDKMSQIQTICISVSR
jgi:hypothetical protein